MITRPALGPLLLAALTVAVPAQAQQGPPQGWNGVAESLVVIQPEADFDAGGGFSAGRAFLRTGGLYSFGGGPSVGLLLSAGKLDYDFSSAGLQPWDDITDFRLSVPVRLPLSDRMTVFVSPSIRWDYEDGADAGDSMTWGAFGGVTWEVSDRLTVGPGLGIFTELGSDDPTVFPALLIDWTFADDWSLSTGTGLGATQGPGLSLSYQPADAWRLSVVARSEDIRFRLNDTGPAPDGIGEDSSVPVVLNVVYEPNPGLSVSAFLGAEFGGELKLLDEDGSTVTRSGYDTSPVAGLSLRLRF